MAGEKELAPTSEHIHYTINGRVLIFEPKEI
ncbi:MAG: hypothetical protein JWP06_628 [Candidatus Saccharibacteria bacterium]|nr:hypothetical protein [Candidatus Saccharibacteria bacterium]